LTCEIYGNFSSNDSKIFTAPIWSQYLYKTFIFVVLTEYPSYYTRRFGGIFS
jgi:hypothetical protein